VEVRATLLNAVSSVTLVSEIHHIPDGHTASAQEVRRGFRSFHHRSHADQGVGGAFPAIGAQKFMTAPDQAICDIQCLI
jgi:hypothetical protein